MDLINFTTQGLDVTLYDIINITLLTLLIITAIAVVTTRNLLTSTIILAIYSLIMASMYLVLEAPDVAMTEASVGAGVTTILMLAALMLTDYKEKKFERPILPLVVIGLTAIALIYATLGMPAFGDPKAPANLHVAPHYINESIKEIGIPNIVTSVLASYRGYDTLGEVFVIFTAGISVLMLLGGSRRSDQK